MACSALHSKNATVAALSHLKARAALVRACQSPLIMYVNNKVVEPAKPPAILMKNRQVIVAAEQAGASAAYRKKMMALLLA